MISTWKSVFTEISFTLQKKIKIKRRERKKERKERKGKLENPGHFMKETFCYEALMIQ